MEITTVYTRQRRVFGRPVNHFAMSDPVAAGSFPDTNDADKITEDKVKMEGQFIVRDPKVLEIEAIPQMSEHSINTERQMFISSGMLHVEGGWPKDVDSTEKEQTTRYRKKVEKDEEYIKQVKALGEGVEHSIMQNSAIDIYEEYFAGEYADHSSEPPSAKTLSVFKDPNEVKRTVCSISWYPDGGKKLAVAFAIMQFQASARPAAERTPRPAQQDETRERHPARQAPARHAHALTPSRRRVDPRRTGGWRACPTSRTSGTSTTPTTPRWSCTRRRRSAASSTTPRTRTCWWAARTTG
tara:strand:+ start:48 stop:941 length:894 start_codon:yes stop_codon:yes gene_type:complete